MHPYYFIKIIFNFHLAHGWGDLLTLFPYIHRKSLSRLKMCVEVQTIFMVKDNHEMRKISDDVLFSSDIDPWVEEV